MPVLKMACAPGARDPRPLCDCFIYVGTYTDRASRGIYACRMSSADGELRALGLAAETANPSFLCVHPSYRFLYAVGEVKVWKGQASGLVTAYAIDRSTGGLGLLNQVASGGAGPCHVAVDNSGTIAIVANYFGGNIAALRIREDGSLGEVTALIQHSDHASGTRLQPRPHGAFISSDNRFAVVPDLGLDRIFIYRLDAETGSLNAADPAFVDVDPGAGPRHFVFHPALPCAYSIDETRSTITSFHYNHLRGALRQMAVTSTLPAGYRGDNMTAEVAIDPMGKFLYVSNRGADSIVVFAVGAQGSLTLREAVPAGGRTPRHFAIDLNGRYLLIANQESDSVVVFRIDRSTGLLTTAGRKIVVSRPACVAFVPAFA